MTSLSTAITLSTFTDLNAFYQKILKCTVLKLATNLQNFEVVDVLVLQLGVELYLLQLNRSCNMFNVNDFKTDENESCLGRACP